VSDGKNDPITARMGMWLFLFSELLLFGALFILFAVALRRYPGEFHAAAGGLNTFFGGVNTAVLITSSACVALAVSALKRQEKVKCMWLVLATILLALVFLGNKGLEWSEKFRHGLYPNGPDLLARPPGEILFYHLYYVMTGLHGLHVAVGLVVFLAALILIHRNRISGVQPEILENSGLYWHLVDIIWIYLFPLFYLIT
jgi:cytochrome c oxidase subunit III